MANITSFVKEAKAELMKVSWPSKKETINYTWAVIIVSIVSAIFLYGLDRVFSEALQKFIIK